jgi:hypothetical protein
MVQVIELGKRKALSSNPSTTKKQTKKSLLSLEN